MIAFVEEVPGGEKWLVVLDERGDLIYRRRVSAKDRPQGVLAPLVSGDQYAADRDKCSTKSLAEV